MPILEARVTSSRAASAAQWFPHYLTTCLGMGHGILREFPQITIPFHKGIHYLIYWVYLHNTSSECLGQAGQKFEGRKREFACRMSARPPTSALHKSNLLCASAFGCSACWCFLGGDVLVVASFVAVVVIWCAVMWCVMCCDVWCLAMWCDVWCDAMWCDVLQWDLKVIWCDVMYCHVIRSDLKWSDAIGWEDGIGMLCDSDVTWLRGRVMWCDVVVWCGELGDDVRGPFQCMVKPWDAKNKKLRHSGLVVSTHEIQSIARSNLWDAMHLLCLPRKMTLQLAHRSTHF